MGRALERVRYRGEMRTGRQDGPIAPIDVSMARRQRMPEQLPLL